MSNIEKYDREEGSPTRFWIILAILLIIAIIVIYFISFGKINLVEQEDEKTKRIRWIDRRLEDLHFHAKSKEELKKSLDERVKRYFFYTRIVLALLYLAANVAVCIWVIDCDKDFNERLSHPFSGEQPY